MIIEVDPDAVVPTYEQIREQVTAMVVAGTLAPGQRLPSIRQLATDLDLANGTVARAYRELDTDGMVISRGRGGTRVAKPEQWGAPATVTDTRNRLAEAAARYATLVRQLGIDTDDATVVLHAALADLDAGTTGA